MGEGDACAYLSSLHHIGPTEIRSNSLAKAWAQKGCDLNDGVSCALLGNLLLEENNVAQNMGEVINAYHKSCELNIGLSCALLANFSSIGVAQHIGTPEALFQKSCDLNYGLGCSSLAESYLYGTGVKKDVATAKRLFKKGCELNESLACARLEQLTGQYYQAVKSSAHQDKYISEVEVALDKIKNFVLESTQSRDVFNLSF